MYWNNGTTIDRTPLLSLDTIGKVRPNHAIALAAFSSDLLFRKFSTAPFSERRLKTVGKFCHGCQSSWMNICVNAPAKQLESISIRLDQEHMKAFSKHWNYHSSRVVIFQSRTVIQKQEARYLYGQRALVAQPNQETRI